MRFFSRLFPLLAFAALAGGCHKSEPQDPRLQKPSELVGVVKSLGLKKVFVNPLARPAFQSLPLAPSSPLDAQAVQTPSLWRKRDRGEHFDGVVLAGQLSEFLPLLNHLSESPDFRLAHVDNWGVLFIRDEPKPYLPPGADALTPKFESTEQRGVYLSQTALLLDAAGESAAAEDYLEAALKCAPREPSVQVRAGALALSHKHYPEALRYTARALELKPHDLSALEVTARTLAAAGAKDEAWQVATQLKTFAPPDDMNALFLHARMASDVHAYSAEQDSLEQLIALAEKRNLPATDYHVYLGQSYAHSGLARPALQQLELALKDPNLSEQQRADLITASAAVRARAGALAQ